MQRDGVLPAGDRSIPWGVVADTRPDGHYQGDLRLLLTNAFAGLEEVAINRNSPQNQGWVKRSGTQQFSRTEKMLEFGQSTSTQATLLRFWKRVLMIQEDSNQNQWFSDSGSFGSNVVFGCLNCFSTGNIPS